MADVNYLSNQLEGVSVQDENYDTNAPPVPLKAKVCAEGALLTYMHTIANTLHRAPQ
jgi:hypothetical protein